MARLHGKDISVLTLAGQTLLADTIAIGPKVSAEMHETHTMGDDWKEFTAGLKGGDDIEHEMFYDDTVTTGSYAYVCGLLGGAASALAITMGARTFGCNVIVKAVSLPMSVGDMLKITATYTITGTVTFG